MKSFEDLEIYKRAVVIRKRIWHLVKSFPQDEKFRLTDQIIRSSRKCPSNISEGHGRFHWQENIQYNRIARGSLTETQNHLNTAEECEYIDQTTRIEMKEYIQVTIKMINGYIRFSQNQKDKT